MIKKPETQQQWLREIDKDQNVSGLTTLSMALKNGPFKKWFVSQVIQPTAEFSVYDPGTGRMVLGGIAPPQAFVQYTAVSAGSDTLDAPAGYYYIVTLAYLQNETRAGTVQMSGVIQGTAMAAIADSGAGAMTVNETEYSIGGATGTSGYAGIAGPVILDGDLGDELTQTNVNYVAADVTYYGWHGYLIRKV